MRRCRLAGRFANTELYVLGPQLELLPIGASGELFIGGTSLSRGYINRHDLTVERFIPHPFSDEAGARLYRTGDRVRYLSDGNLEFLGRLDDQVKIHGVRVELPEVEAAIGTHPLVQQAAVTAPLDASGERQLVAYDIPRQPEPSSAELRHFLHQMLPDSMVPSVFMRLDALPLTTSGKIDRRSTPRAGPHAQRLRRSLCGTSKPGGGIDQRGLEAGSSRPHDRRPRQFLRARRTFAACRSGHHEAPHSVRAGSAAARAVRIADDCRAGSTNRGDPARRQVVSGPIS